jgi:hypothetical protein
MCASLSAGSSKAGAASDSGEVSAGPERTSLSLEARPSGAST